MKPFVDQKNNNNLNVLNRKDNSSTTTHIYLYFTFEATVSIKQSLRFPCVRPNHKH